MLDSHVVVTKSDRCRVFSKYLGVLPHKYYTNTNTNIGANELA